VLVVALLLAAVSTGAFARKLPSPDPDSDGHPIGALHSGRLGAEKHALDHSRTGAADLNRTIVASIAATTPVMIARLCKAERI
jgi:hypothetical protein